jgi:hypothetical protein
VATCRWCGVIEMRINRRDFVKSIAVVPLVGTNSPVPTWAVTRGTMWSPDRTAAETLSRCNRHLAANPDDVLALAHRGQVSSIYYEPTLGWADLSRAISLEPSPCCFYLRGVCFDVVADLRHAVWLLSQMDDGPARRSAVPSLTTTAGRAPKPVR